MNRPPRDPAAVAFSPPQGYGSFNFAPQGTSNAAAHDQARREAELAQKEREVAARERKFEEKRALLLCCDYEALQQIGRPSWRQAPAQWHAIGSRIFLCWLLTAAVFAWNFVCEVGLDFASYSSIPDEAVAAPGSSDDPDTLYVGNPASSMSAGYMNSGGASDIVDGGDTLGSDAAATVIANVTSRISRAGGGLRAVGGAVAGAGAVPAPTSNLLQTVLHALRSLAPVDEMAAIGAEQTALGGQTGLATVLLVGVPVVAWLGWAHPLTEAALVDGTSDRAGRAALMVLAGHGCFCALAAVAPPGCGLCGFTIALHAAHAGWRFAAAAATLAGSGFAAIAVMSFILPRGARRARLVQWPDLPDGGQTSGLRAAPGGFGPPGGGGGAPKYGRI